MNYTAIVDEIGFRKNIYVPNNIENKDSYISEWLFAEYGITNNYNIKVIKGD